MRFLSICLLADFIAFGLASPAWLSPWSHKDSNIDSHGLEHTSPRPTLSCHPKTPRLPLPSHPTRTKICYVSSHHDGTDDSSYILSAVNSCNNGGHVIFKKDMQYTIGTALDLRFLRHIDLDIQGTIRFTNDTDYWQANSFRLIFQNATTFWQIGGVDVNIYGGGTIDGQGQAWYDLYASNIYTLRPILMGIVDLHNASISNLVLRYSPQYYHFVTNSSNVVFDGIDIAGGSRSKHVAKNTDGWDTYRVRDVVIQNSVVNNGDDCVSFKPNSTNVLVQNMWCNGSHGISVGSLGQYKGEFDIVENIYVYNTSLHNATDGARIKVWPNTASALSGDLQGGGGSGRAKNITYDTMQIDNVDYAIELTQCYGQSNLTLCNLYPSPLTISDVLFTHFTGKTSKKYMPQTSVFACSSPAVCSNIVASDIEVSSPNGTREAYCQNVDVGTLDVECTGVSKGFN